MPTSFVEFKVSFDNPKDTLFNQDLQELTEQRVKSLGSDGRLLMKKKWVTKKFIWST